MLVTQQTTRRWRAACPRHLRKLNALQLRIPRRKAACNAVEITGDAYEDIVDQLARRVLTQRARATLNTPDTPTSKPTSLTFDPSRRVVVGISGAPGSGKTTLAAAVAARVNDLQAEADAAGAGAAADTAVGRAPFAAVMPMDGFHYYRRELDAMPDPVVGLGGRRRGAGSRSCSGRRGRRCGTGEAPVALGLRGAEQEAHARRGAPWTFNATKFVEAVRQVRLAGEGAGEVLLPSFDHGVGDPVEEDIVVAAETRVVLVEGNYLLLDEEPWRQLRDLFDETWFVSAPLDLVTQRLFDRQTGIGLAPEVSLERIRTNDLPNAELVAGCCGAASVLVPGWVAPRAAREAHGAPAPTPASASAAASS